MNGEGAVKEIALWGYGRYGKRLLKALLDRWSARYRVVAVYDRKAPEEGDRLGHGGPLLNTARLQDDYRAGRFDGLLAGSVTVAVREQIEQQAREWGVPITTLVTPEDFRPFEEFEGTSTRELPYGFKLHEYRSLYANYSDLYQWQTPLYLFDERGTLVADNWNKELLLTDSGVFNCGAPPCVEEARVVEMPGEYCVVMRQYNTNYWHFTFQCLDQIKALEQAGYQGNYVLARSGFSDQLLDLAGFDRRRVLWANELDRNKIYHFERVSIVAGRGYDGGRSARPLVDVAQTIKENAAKLEDGTVRYPSRLFVKRIGYRKLLGAEPLLEKYGFTTVVPEELTVDQQIRYFQNADIVLSPPRRQLDELAVHARRRGTYRNVRERMGSAGVRVHP